MSAAGPDAEPTEKPTEPEGEGSPGPAWVPGREVVGADLAWAGLVAVAAVVTAMAFRSALVPVDPWHYVQGALVFPEGTWRPAGDTRWGYIVMIVPFTWLWGDATASYYAVPLLSTGALAGVLYLLGTRYVSRTAGVLSALLALASPLVFVNLTRGYPDVTATAMIGLAILLATLAGDAARRAEANGAGWGWQVPALLITCGVVTGWSFEIRETAVLAWPAIGWILWRVGRPLRTLAWFAPPALAWLVLDLGLSAAVYGDPWLKLRIITGSDLSDSDVASSGRYTGHSRWWYATVLPRSLWEKPGGPALLASLAVGLVGGLALRAHLGRIWAWGFLALGLFWLQGGPIDPAHPSVRLDVLRYSISFIVPLMLAAVGTVVILVHRTRGIWRGAVAAGGPLLALGTLSSAYQYATSYPALAPNGGLAMSELRTHLSTTGGLSGHQVWSDWATRRILTVYRSGPLGGPRWDASQLSSLNGLHRDPPTSQRGYPQPDDFVVLYSTSDQTCRWCRGALKKAERYFGDFPQAGWEMEFRSSTGNLTLYRLGPGTVWPEARTAGN